MNTVEEGKLCDECYAWLSMQPENTSKAIQFKVMSVMDGIIHNYDRGFIGALARNDLRKACRLADDIDIKLLPLYARFMDWLEEQR